MALLALVFVVVTGVIYWLETAQCRVVSEAEERSSWTDFVRVSGISDQVNRAYFLAETRSGPLYCVIDGGKLGHADLAVWDWNFPNRAGTHWNGRSRVFDGYQGRILNRQRLTEPPFGVEVQQSGGQHTDVRYLNISVREAGSYEFPVLVDALDDNVTNYQQGPMRHAQEGGRRVGADPGGASSAPSGSKRARSRQKLQATDNHQVESESRHAVVRLSDAVIRRVLAISAFCGGLLFLGSWFGSRDGYVDRWFGLLSALSGATGFGLTWLWLFGWL